MRAKFCLLLIPLLGTAAFLYSQSALEVPQSFEAPGGYLTLDIATKHSFEALPQIKEKLPSIMQKEFGFQFLEFGAGRRLFRSAWMEAPDSNKNLDGLGPFFNAKSCASCHIRDGKGRSDLDLGMLLKIHHLTGKGKLEADSKYGSQLQPHMVQRLVHRNGNLIEARGEVDMILDYEIIRGRYPDGTAYELRKPVLNTKASRLYYGDFDSFSILSFRTAPHLVGVGLLEAISEERLHEQEDEHDQNGDGISGRIHWAYDGTQKKYRPGRFGWRADAPTLRQQNSAALRHDMGLSNAVFPTDDVSEFQHQKLGDYIAGHSQQEGYEVDDRSLAKLVLYTHLLPVPTFRNVHTEKFQQGFQTFHEIGCENCHTATHQTDPNYDGLRVLAGQTIHPFTDLLLHDMGDELADVAWEADDETPFPATTREWRTPPLWGIGLVQTVNSEASFLHDGRARTLEEAILWHGGEAEKSKDNFKQLSKQQRQALLFFLESL